MAGYTKRYRENRLVVLAGNPLCAWCQKRPATTADHVVEKDRGGSDELDNLVPACQKCNYARGARYGNEKRSRLIQARTEAVERSERARGTTTARKASKPAETAVGPFLGPSAENPGPDMVSISDKPKPKRPKAARKQPAAVGLDPGTPRLETARHGGSSFGPLVVDWARRELGVELMPWQARVLSGMLEHDGPTDDSPGRLRHRLASVSVARQNGKTTALRALAGWALTDCARIRRQPQTLITTAHALDLATALFDELAPVLVERHGGKAKWSYGRQELRMPDGSVWLVRAATPSAGHGRSPDWIIADETWNISEDVIDQGLIPAQRARPSPLFSSWSTAGTEASRWLLRMRESGLRAIDAGTPGPLYFAEYSPAPSADMGDPQSWTAANPALGHTLDLQTLVDESRSPNRAAFMRASLNLWVAADSAWLQPGTWDALRVEIERPTTTVLAVDLSTDGSRYSGVAAGLDADGRAVMSVAFQTSTSAELWAQIDAQLPPTATLAVTPPLEIHVPPRLKPRTTTVGYGELVRWTGLVERFVNEGRIVHTGDVALSDHMARAVSVKTSNGLVLSSQKSPGPIELARLTVFAAALALTPKTRQRPVIGRSGTNRPSLSP